MEKRIENYVFDITKPIGQGSFSKVYLGKNELTGMKVAVKVIDVKIIND